MAWQSGTMRPQSVWPRPTQALVFFFSLFVDIRSDPSGARQDHECYMQPFTSSWCLANNNGEGPYSDRLLSGYRLSMFRPQTVQCFVVARSGILSFSPHRGRGARTRLRMSSDLDHQRHPRAPWSSSPPDLHGRLSPHHQCWAEDPRRIHGSKCRNISAKKRRRTPTVQLPIRIRAANDGVNWVHDRFSCIGCRQKYGAADRVAQQKWHTRLALRTLIHL